MRLSVGTAVHAWVLVPNFQVLVSLLSMTLMAKAGAAKVLWKKKAKIRGSMCRVGNMQTYSFASVSPVLHPSSIFHMPLGQSIGNPSQNHP